MSCYEWEHGVIKLPSSEYATFKKKIREAYNGLQVIRFKRLEVIHGLITKHLVGKRKVNIKGLIGDWDENCWPSTRPSNYPQPKDYQWRDAYKLEKGGKLYKPKKQDFPPATNKKLDFDVEEGGIYFNDKNKTVEWSVPDNNHACDTAHEHPLAQVFFRELEKINWTRGTGGQIIGNDEYNQDSSHLGGGGNYLKMEFGPKIKTTYRRKGR